jgi:hypothetical protein
MDRRLPRRAKRRARVVQWFEHGGPIDRIESVYRRGKREGFGRYDWPTGDRFEGTYAEDLPNGLGTERSTACRAGAGRSEQRA